VDIQRVEVIGQLELRFDGEFQGTGVAINAATPCRLQTCPGALLEPGALSDATSGKSTGPEWC
jgi:hypothetical protein